MQSILNDLYFARENENLVKTIFSSVGYEFLRTIETGESVTYIVIFKGGKYVVKIAKTLSILEISLGDREECEKAHIMPILARLTSKDGTISAIIMPGDDVTDTFKPPSGPVAVAKFIRAMALALKHLDQRSVVNLDLRLGNVMFKNGDIEYPIMINFGSSYCRDKESGCRSIQGGDLNIGFAGSSASNVQYLGKTLYTLLFSSLVGNGRLDVIHGRSDLLCYLLGPPPHWVNPDIVKMLFTPEPEYVNRIHSLTAVCRNNLQLEDMLRGMLDYDPCARLTPNEILKHPFLTTNLNECSLDSTSSVASIATGTGRSGKYSHGGRNPSKMNIESTLQKTTLSGPWTVSVIEESPFNPRLYLLGELHAFNFNLPETVRVVDWMISMKFPRIMLETNEYCMSTYDPDPDMGEIQTIAQQMREMRVPFILGDTRPELESFDPAVVDQFVSKAFVACNHFNPDTFKIAQKNEYLEPMVSFKRHCLQSLLLFVQVGAVADDFFKEVFFGNSAVSNGLGTVLTGLRRKYMASPFVNQSERFFEIIMRNQMMPGQWSFQWGESIGCIFNIPLVTLDMILTIAEERTTICCYYGDLHIRDLINFYKAFGANVIPIPANGINVSAELIRRETQPNFSDRVPRLKFTI